MVGNRDIKDINIRGKYSQKNQFYAHLNFDIENSIDTWVEIFPYRNLAFVDAMVEYEIIDVNGIEVRHQKTEYNKNLYHWDKGGHSYYMVAESILEEDLYDIINGLSIEISDENVVKECLRLRGY